MSNNKNHKQDIDKQFSTAKINVLFVIVVALIQLLSIAIVFVLSYIFIWTGVVEEEDFFTWALFPIGISTVLLGIGLSFLVSRFLLDPFKKLLTGMNSLSKGKYDTRLDFGKNKTMKVVEENFNDMASELSKIEILRSDFVNNFSHEFKTPIASINGLLELLKRDDLTSEKRKEYIAIIEEETRRLLDMSTNVLTLSKIENVTELKGLVRYNIAEQIRNCIVLLEKKWVKKNLELRLEMSEETIRANEEMLMQVWVNLLDNAIKFANENSELAVELYTKDGLLTINISNYGVAIKEEEREKIFNKFYQADTIHTKEGNGIGLSVVKHIISLHNGTIVAGSENGKTTFTIELPL